MFRNKHTGELVLMAHNGWFFTHDGYRLVLDRPFAEAEFVSSLVQNDKIIRGTIIDPRGFALLNKEVEDTREASSESIFLQYPLQLPTVQGLFQALRQLVDCSVRQRQAGRPALVVFHAKLPAVML